MNLLEALKNIRDEGPSQPLFGLCGNVGYSCEEIDRIGVLAREWPEWSGCLDAPVPHPTLSPKEAYSEATSIEMWGDGEYAAARHRLLDFLIAKLEAEES